jgi:hypothetical protein
MVQDQPKSEQLTLDLPALVLKDIRALVDAGVYLSVEEALREFVLASWRVVRGSYHTILIEPKPADVDEAGARPGA